MKDRLPLAGIRVLELCTMIAGPLCGKYLALAGAEVIRVENPMRLEPARFGDYAGNKVTDNYWERGGRFHEYNTNKKGIGVDWHNPKGIELCQRLAGISDVIIENFSPGVLERRSLDYTSLRRLKPDIIMLSSSAYGQTGPWRSYKGYGPTVEALSGLVHMSGYPDKHPAVAGRAMLSDIAAAMFSYYLILAGLNYRKRAKKGLYIDLSQYAMVVSLMGDIFLEAMVNNKNPGRMGNRDRVMSPHNVYRCRGDDKWVSIAVSTDDEWKKLCGVMGSPLWCGDEKFADATSRYSNQNELDKLIEAWTIDYEHYEVMEKLQKAGIAAAPVLNAKEVLLDPHFRDRRFFHKVDFPPYGNDEEADKRIHMGLPWSMPQSDYKVKPSPRLGQHNREVFQGILGLSEEEFGKMVEEGVISDNPAPAFLKTGGLIEPVPEDVSKELGLIREYDADHEKRLGLK